MHRSKLSKNANHTNEADQDDILLLLDNIPKLNTAFDVLERIGNGTFSSVYLGKSKNSKHQQVAIKHIIPTSHPSRVYMELKCLKLLGGKDNIVEALMCFRSMNHIAFIMPYVYQDRFTDYCGHLSTEEICDYIVNLFIALRRVHSFNIIHRDIKPPNFLYSRKYRKYSLVDFGLAQDVHKGSTSDMIMTNLLNSGTSSANSSRMDAKRKCSTTMNEREPKKARQFSPKSNASRSPLSSTEVIVNGLDSPSKHTRLAELCKRTPGFDKNEKHFNFGCSNTPLKSGRVDLPITVPQSMSSSINIRTPTLQEVKTSKGSQLVPSSCTCYGSGRICRVCTGRSTQIAPRAGTPGYRAPEVLVRHPFQNTAVDIWSAGVIILSLISGQYPFFQATEDLTSLAEITTVFGTKFMRKICCRLDKLLSCSENKPPLDLRKICKILRVKFMKNLDVDKDSMSKKCPLPSTTMVCHQCLQTRICICATDSTNYKRVSYSVPSKISASIETTDSPQCINGDSHTQRETSALKQLLGNNDKIPELDSLCDHADFDPYPQSLYDLLLKLLDPYPASRITANDVLKHPFVKMFSKINS